MFKVAAVVSYMNTVNRDTLLREPASILHLCIDFQLIQVFHYTYTRVLSLVVHSLWKHFKPSSAIRQDRTVN